LKYSPDTATAAVARQTAKHSHPEIFVASLSDRIAGLAASQDLLVKNQRQGAEVANLVEAQLAHFKDHIGTRVLLEGPPV
jgi:two-component sensor histidine kinase